jgi:hypothetical protein
MTCSLSLRSALPVVFVALATAVAAQDAPQCPTADECRRLTREAISAGQFERAHDLAWLAFQKAPRQHPETMTLLARAQSLSGRGDDAYVMLRRLAEARISVADVRDSDDFRRVRSHPQWPQLLALFDEIPAPAPATADVATSPSPPSANAAAPPPPNAASANAATIVTEDLTVPHTVALPVAMAYDAVSARFVLANAADDGLTVLSETSTNATAFTSAGWSGGLTITALAIDRGAGDLWVAARTTSGATLHRLQLISGRRLEALEAPPGGAEVAAIAPSRDGVFALDARRRRVLRRTPQSKVLSVYASLTPKIEPTGLTVARDALLVAHASGVVRVERPAQRQQPLRAAKAASIGNLHSLGWHDGILMGIQRSADRLSVVRLHLNASGTTVTRVETLAAAASTAATLFGSTYYFAALDEDTGAVVVRAIAVK